LLTPKKQLFTIMCIWDGNEPGSKTSLKHTRVWNSLPGCKNLYPPMRLLFIFMSWVWNTWVQN
jgi:hypothetical protein